MKTNNSNYNLWTLCENYLDIQNSYSITSVGRNEITVYKATAEQPTIIKVLQVLSYLSFPVISLGALIYRGICRKVYSFQVLQPNVSSKLSSACDAIATKDCADTHAWRKKLIAIAQHNIVISGNYCGGEAFDETLKCIENRMKQVPTLEVVIISHNKFLINSKSKGIQNKELLKRLNTKFPHRFKIIYSNDEIYHLKKVTNHSKITVIDYGRYFMQGGSGIKDIFLSVGLLKDQYIKKPSQKKVNDDSSPPPKIQKTIKPPGKISSDDFEIDYVNYSKNLPSRNHGKSFIERFLPNSFRDQDFLFKSKGKSEVGKQFFREALFLAYKWDQFNKNGFLSADSWDLDKLDKQDSLFSKFTALAANPIEKGTDDEEEKNVLFRMLKRSIPEHITDEANSHNISDFQSNKISDVSVRAFFTGPEDIRSDWEENLLYRINGATKRLVIDQMYFQPSPKLLTAIANAANRGVKVSVITVINSKHGSKSENFFGDRNLHNLNSLFYQVKKEARTNLHLYHFAQAKNSLHKKVVVADNFVLAGSSNMGTKSLELMGDHEMNFEAESRDFANMTLKIIQEDISSSWKFKNVPLTLKNRIKSEFHRLGARLWG